jgi:peptidoglycan/xylan/chitin deacetylase (PgdA/CDA1 family)
VRRNRSGILHVGQNGFAWRVPDSRAVHFLTDWNERNVLHPRLTRYQMLVGGTLCAAALIFIFFHGAACFWWLAALCSLSGLGVGLGVSFPQWQMFGESICAGATKRKIVALTFDDGPDAENTSALLALLAERKVRGTFFCIGKRVARQPELVKHMVAEGHRIENHAFQHSSQTNIFSVRRLRDDLAQAQMEIQRVAGRAPEFFRPPVGLTNPRIFRVTGELGLKVIGYTARGLDRRADAPEKIVGRLLRKLQPGAIFLLHDAGVPCERLLAVVTLLLDKLEAEGYQCVRLDELIAEK